VNDHTSNDNPKSTENSKYAIFSKTTKAIRTMLTDHEITFTMPNQTQQQQQQQQQPSSSSSSSTCTCSCVCPCSCSISIGCAPPVDLERTRSLHSIRVQQQITKEFDSTPASVCVISGRENVHMLFDMLLNQDRRMSKQIINVNVPIHLCYVYVDVELMLL
jgi:hypothetical protein